jgi:uncharacterized membrane protein YvlD (DUF360 family)
MENKDNSFVQKWKKVREKGLLRHMISTGLSFGILVFVILSIYTWIVTDQAYKSTYDFLIQLIISVVIGGGIYALVIWFLNEYMYKKKTGEN